MTSNGSSEDTRASLSNSNSYEKQVDPEEELFPPKEVLNDHDPNTDAGYAWVVCAACVLFNFCTWGMNSGFAIYFAYYLKHQTYDGADKLDYSYIGGIAFGVGLAFSPLITVCMGIFGFKPVLIVGNCLQFTALMLASWSTKLWQLYLTQGLMQSFGLAFLSIPSITLLPQWFKKRRVLAGGIASAGSGMGGVVFNLGMQKVVDHSGVHWALRAQSIIGFGLTWIAIFAAKSKASKHNIEFKFIDSTVFRSAGFYLVLFFVLTCIFGYVIVLYTLANFTQSLGYSEHQGAIVSAMVQVGSFFGRPVIGYLSDKLGAASVATVAYYIVGIFCLAMWIPARNYATVVVFALIEGGLMGSIYAIIAPLMAQMFGIRKMNIVFGKVWCIMGVAGVFSPVIGVKLVRGSGANVDPTSYRNCSIFTGVMFVACATTMLIIRGYLKARDEIINEDGLADSDHVDTTQVTVPFLSVFTHLFTIGGGKA